jgi:hypothetical protein
MCISKIPVDQSGRFTHMVPTLSAGRYLALATLTILFWLLTHPYSGIWHDARLYTVQALNILYPDIYQEDLFFKYGSQASFTLFPRLHALLIEQIGIDLSALTLTIIGQVLFFTGIISLTRHFLTLGQIVLFLIIFTTLPTYNNPILNIFEVFVTSRTISAGLSLLFLTFFLKKRFLAAIVTLIIALLLHPLMPLGVMAITLFLLRPKVIITFIALGFVLVIICYVFAIPPINQLGLVIDNEWRDLVTQRAPFLFVELWSDQDLNQFFLEICIILSARAYCSDKLRQTFNAVLIAASVCMLISLIGSWLSNALLIQLQTWRILLFVHIFSAIAFAWLISSAWNMNSGKVVILLYFAIFLLINFTGVLPALALHVFWVYSLKRHLTTHHLAVIGAYAILVQGVLWYIFNTAIDLEIFTSNSTPDLLSIIRYLLHISPFFFTALLMALFLFTKYLQKIYSILLSIGILLLAPTAILYFDQRNSNQIWDEGNAEPYITLREMIPNTATVLCVEGVRDCWFKLRRKHYMSLAQSAGIVFSKETAHEAKRRADLLANTGYREEISSIHWYNNPSINPPEKIKVAFDELCQDPALDYIVSKLPIMLKSADKIVDTAGSRVYIYNCYQSK